MGYINMKKFNKDNYLKKLRFMKYKRYLYMGIPCILVLLIGIYFAYSKFSVFKEEEVVRTTVGEFISGDAVIGAYIDGEYSKSIPGKNDGYIVDKIVCDNDATGSWNNDSWGIVLTNLTKRTKCNVYFVVKPVPVVEKVTTAMNSNPSMFATDDPGKNVRYIGADPSNYVYFNCSDYSNPTADTCELWRIIGVFNNVTKGDGSNENLVKIIRVDSLGKYPWDNKFMGGVIGYGSNDWSTATLQQDLNSGTYYTTTLKNDTTRNAIEEVVWNLGGTDDDETSTASMFYAAERGTTVYSGRPTTWTGKIGLMYSSDYGYATSGGTTKDRAACLAKELYNWDSSDFNDCRGNDYLYNSSLRLYQWTLSPNSADAYGVFRVPEDGRVDRIEVYTSNSVRPALFLKSNIQVDKGTGAKSDPYRLKM